MTLSRIRFLVLVAACLVLTPSIPAQDKGKRDFQKDNPKVLAAFKEVVAKPSQSVVRILCDGKEASLGVVVSADGWVLTKNSELKGKPLCRFKDGRELEAKVVGVHDKHDLALLKVEAKDLKPVEWADSNMAPVGNWVAAPGLGDVPVAFGVVSVAARAVKGPATPVAGGGFLGVSLEPNDAGVKITQVLLETTAAKIELKVGDIITSVNSKAVDGLENFMETLARHKAGDVVKLHVKRGDKELDFEAKLGQRPAVGNGDVQNSLGSDLSKRRNGFPNILQTDAVLKPTDCGGPLVDLDGKVIGVTIARAGRTESFAVPSEVVRGLLPELMSGKLAPPKEPSLIEKLAAARLAVEQAEKLKAAADQKATDQKKALEAAEKERLAAEKRLTEARAALEKAEKEAKEPEKK